MKNRLFKNKFTSIIGAIVMAGSVVSVFMGIGITWSDAVIGITVGCGLLLFKDPSYFKRKDEHA